MRRHKLLTKAIQKQLKPLYHYENSDPQNVLVPLKIFDPTSQWTWYLFEYNPDTRIAFGFVVGLEAELGYVSLEELEAVRGRLGLPLERDKWWNPTPLSEIKARHGK